MKKRKNSSSAKPLILFLIILLALGAVLGYIWRILSNADYFLVNDVVSRESVRADLSYLKGKNIFSLNLTQEANRIARSCPDCLRVRLARVLPDRIYLELIRRRPVALIKLYRYFAVDEHGFIFASSTQPEYGGVSAEQAGLPVIAGLETKVFGPRPGIRYENEELFAALSIIKEASRTPLLRGYKIQKINVAGIDNITVQIPVPGPQGHYSGWKAPGKKAFLEIKFGRGGIRDKVAIMAGLINQEKQNLGNIKYIDLRFNEPVIKFREDNNKVKNK